MTPLEQALNETLLHFLWQGAIVGLLLWLTMAFMRNTSPNARYVVCCCALAVLFLLPLVTLATAYSSYASPGNTAPGGTRFGEVPRPPNLLIPTAASWLIGLKSWASRVWAVGVVLCGIRLIWSWNYTRRLRSDGTEPDRPTTWMVYKVAARLGVRRKVRLLMSTLADVPGAIGWLRPVLLLPASAVVGLTPEQLESVIAHELAHIRRHDYIVNVFQSLVEALLFYHPAVWWVSARIRDERELCCDDVAVGYCGDTVCYARALTLLEKQRMLRPGLAVSSAGGQLLYRIRRLLMSDPREYNPLRLVCGLALLTAVLGLALHIDAAEGSRQHENTIRSEAVLAAPQVSGVESVAALSAVERVQSRSVAPLGNIVNSGLKAENPDAESARQLVLQLGGTAQLPGQDPSQAQTREARERAEEERAIAEKLRNNASFLSELMARFAEVRREAEQAQAGANAAQVAGEADYMNQIQRFSEEIRRLQAERQAELQSSLTKLQAEQTNIEAELRRSLDKANAQIRSMQAELASVRAELARERAVSAEQVQPDIDEVLKNVESLQNDLRRVIESIRRGETR